jgi:hypothetical protein
VPQPTTLPRAPIITSSGEKYKIQASRNSKYEFILKVKIERTLLADPHVGYIFMPTIRNQKSAAF